MPFYVFKKKKAHKKNKTEFHISVKDVREVTEFNFDRLILILFSVPDDSAGFKMAKGRGRPELRLHVQAADYRKQFRWENVLPVPLRRR